MENNKIKLTLLNESISTTLYDTIQRQLKNNKTNKLDFVNSMC